jgi:hypothetical protein
MKKKLLFVSPEQFGYLSDHYYYCKYLKNNFEIDFICFDKEQPKINEEGVNIIYLNFNQNKLQRLLYFIFYAIRITRKNIYDILLTDYFKMVFIIGLLGKAKLKILDVKTGSLNDNILFRWLFNRIILFSSLFFHKTTVLSESLAKRLILAKKRTVVVPLGADILDETEKQYNKMNLIYIGTLHKRNIEEAIKGFAKFYTQHKDKITLRYDIIGFSHINDDVERLETVINENKLNNVVIFHGRKNHQQLKEYIQNATIGICFVPQTPYYDVQPPTQIFEYALSGLITIATNTAENRRFITGMNGVICEDNADSFCDAMEKVYANLDEYNDRKIRESLNEYNWENIVKIILIPILEN